MIKKSSYNCGFELTLELVGGKWKGLILWKLQEKGVLRYGELSREDIVKDKVLSDQWNKLMMKVKKLGRGVQNYDEAYWESRRYKIVLFGVRLKFTQNPDLKDILMATGESKMIESSPYDKL